MTHEEKLYDLQWWVTGFIKNKFSVCDDYLLRTVILDYFTVEKIKEFEAIPNYSVCSKQIIQRYKDAFCWQNGIVQYIIKSKREMGHWCNG